MTLDRLRAYRSIGLKLDRLREELAEHYVCEPVSGSRGAPSFAKTTRYAEGYPSTPRVAALEREIAALEAEITEVERFADNLDDPELREIVRLRFMAPRRHSWQEIALALGYRAEHTPKRKLAAYLEVYNMNKNEP